MRITDQRGILGKLHLIFPSEIQEGAAAIRA